MRSEFIATPNFCASNLASISSSQFFPRITRRNLLREPNRGALQSETTFGIAARIRGQSSDSAPSGSRSPSRSARPSHPPKRARKSVARLPRISGTSIPPEIASQARPPRFGEISMIARWDRSEEHTSELQSHVNLVCRLLLEKKKKKKKQIKNSQ